MNRILNFLKVRIIDHWQTSLIAVMVLIGYHWFNKGKIDFAGFQEYMIVIPSIILLLMKDFKNGEQH